MVDTRQVDQGNPISRIVASNGCDIHVTIVGEGRATVLLHGWPQHGRAWRRIWPRIAAAERQVVMIDLRGFGWSDAPPGPYTKAALADDVVAVLIALGIDEFDLVGHDWGGFIGFLVASRCTPPPAARVEAALPRMGCFIGINTSHPWQQRGPFLRSAPRLLYQVPIAVPLLGPWLLRHELTGFLLRHGVTPGSKIDPDAMASYVERIAQPARARASSALYRSFLMQELLPMLRGDNHNRRVRAPVLLLLGRHDPALPRRMADGVFAHTDLCVIEELEVGHFSLDDAVGAETIGARIVAFLADHR